MLTLTLASASPARLATLRAAGIEPQVLVADVDEPAIAAAHAGAPENEVVAALAAAKLAAIVAQAPDTDLVVACDSMLLFDGELCGKPHDPQTARQRWQRMRGHSGTLLTGHALTRMDTQQTVVATATTVVHFANLSDAEIDAYVATGEPLLVAGGFTVDGLGGPFVTGIEGDYHAVVGISLPLLRDLVMQVGHNWHQLWPTCN